MQTWNFFFFNFDLEVNEKRVLLTEKSKLSHECNGNEHFETSCHALVEVTRKITPSTYTHECVVDVACRRAEQTTLS